MHIDKIYINTHRYDLRFTKICIASIRYWYPDIPVYLIVDYSNGTVNPDRINKAWGVQVLETGRQKYGWGFGKFEPLFSSDKETFLVLDADTVFAGPVLNKVSKLEADFVVDKEVQPIEKFKLLYYDPQEVLNLYPDFQYPAYSFNTGQWIGTSGVLQKKDFGSLITWEPFPKLTFPKFFKQADQGLFNLVIHVKEQNKEISVEKIPLMIWPENGAADFINLEIIKKKGTDYPFIIHWAGMKHDSFSAYPKADVLFFYEKYYYTKYNSFSKYIDKCMDYYLNKEKKVLFGLKRIKQAFVK